MCIRDSRERNRQQLGEGLREQRLAGARRTDEQDVRLGQLDVVAAARLLLNFDPLVMVVDGNRELFLRPLLTDDVLVEELLDVRRGRQRRTDAAVFEAIVVRDDVVADLDAFIADEYCRARDQLADVVLIFIAERAAENLSLAVLLHHNSLEKPELRPAKVSWIQGLSTPEPGRFNWMLHPFTDDVID